MKHLGTPIGPRTFVFALFFGGACTVACSSKTSGEAATKDAAMDDAGGTVGAEDAGFSCSAGCSNTAPAGAICAISADAQLIDTAGNAASGEVLFLCGTNLCSFPVTTNTEGKAHFNLCLNMASPALKFLGGSSYASFAVGMSGPTETFSPITIVPLPAQGEAFPVGGGSVTSGAVTLVVADGGVKFDPAQPDDAGAIEFRAAAITPAQAPPGLDPSLGIKALWGLAPANATLNPPGSLTIPNPDPTDWTPGMQVNFVMNSLNETPEAPVAYGTWGAIGTGTVSSDGTTITTDSDAGDGLPLIGIVGVGPHL